MVRVQVPQFEESKNWSASKIMSLEKPQQEPKNPLTSEHLKEGVRPIIAAVGTREQFENHPGAGRDLFNATLRALGNTPTRNVNYYGNPAELTSESFKNAGMHSYVISTIDNANKFSEGYADCTGLVVAGQDKETGENVSFLSHQDPSYFLTLVGLEANFKRDLKERLEEFKRRCKEGTIDAVIVGGNYFIDKFPEHDHEYRAKYLQSINLLKGEVSQVFGFEPVVMTGPKIVSGKDNIFYDNERRRLYVVRPEVGDASTESFAPGTVKEQEKKWGQQM
ncbi:MAG: hypothetical protein HY455_01575 [Parcubacteria group bacterium]|nr:hypothetical protein [Parcubacteria group bacterium]